MNNKKNPMADQRSIPNYTIMLTRKLSVTLSHAHIHSLSHSRAFYNSLTHTRPLTIMLSVTLSLSHGAHPVRIGAVLLPT